MPDAMEHAASFGIDAETARQVVDAFAKVAKQTGRRYDPTTWSKTVWLAEADRWRRSPSPEAHYSLLLQLERLRGQWEERYEQGKRGWFAGEVGERLTKR